MSGPGEEYAYLPADESRQLRTVWSQMPYAEDIDVLGLSRGSHRDPVAVRDVVEAMTRLAEKLREVAREADANEAELHQLQRERAGARSWLGLPVRSPED